MAKLFPSESPILRVNRERGFDWSLNEIARAIGAEPSTISRLVNRTSLSPDFSTIWKLAQVFGVSVEELVDPAWFRSDDVVSPHGVEVARQFDLQPSEELKRDGPAEFIERFGEQGRRLKQERTPIPEPGRKGSRTAPAS